MRRRDDDSTPVPDDHVTPELQPDSDQVARGLSGGDEPDADEPDTDEPDPADRAGAGAPAGDVPPPDAVSADDIVEAAEDAEPTAPQSGDSDARGDEGAGGDGGADEAEQVVAEDPAPETVPVGPLHLAYSATSHVGKIRKNNQDSGYASGNLLVVADGMGGAAAGDLASAVAIESISKVDRRVEGEDMLSVLAEAIRKANDKIADLVANDHALEGMGTTVSGALFDGHEIGLAHIGDSRAYLLRGGELRRITHDHSWVQSLMDDGKITEDEAAYHPHRSLLLRVLNGQPANDPDLSMITVSAGDRLLFCSDGLCGFVTDDVITEHLGLAERGDALQALLDEALEAGGLDNITIVLADVVIAEETEIPAPLMLGAATEVEIPHLEVASRVIDLGDTDDTPHRSAKPTAPAPRSAAADEDERYAPIKPPRWRWFRRLVAVCLVVLVLLGLGGAGLAWSRTQYYLGPDGDQVAIYQGLPDQVPLVQMSRLYEVQDITITDLPPFFADQVRSNSISASTLEQIRQSTAQLRDAADRCVQQRQSPSPSPTAPASPSRSSSRSPSSSGSSSRSASSSADPSSSAPATPAASSSPTSTPAGTSSPGQDGSC